MKCMSIWHIGFFHITCRRKNFFPLSKHFKSKESFADSFHDTWQSVITCLWGLFFSPFCPENKIFFANYCIKTLRMSNFKKSFNFGWGCFSSSWLFDYGWPILSVFTHPASTLCVPQLQSKFLNRANFKVNMLHVRLWFKLYKLTELERQKRKRSRFAKEWPSF